MRNGKQGRTPHGVRGLKFCSRYSALLKNSRTPHGVRGLKYQLVSNHRCCFGSRTPHGVRGLKLMFFDSQYIA